MASPTCDTYRGASLVENVEELAEQVIGVSQAAVIRPPHQRLVAGEAIIGEGHTLTTTVKVGVRHLGAVVKANVRHLHIQKEKES